MPASPFAPGTVPRLVCVLAREATDLRIMARLVESLGHVACFGPDPDDPGTDPDGYPVQATRRLAVVVCQRHGDTSMLALVDRCARRGDRTLVFTECLDHDAVVAAFDAGARHVFSLAGSESTLRTRLAAALPVPTGRLAVTLVVGPFTFDVDCGDVRLRGRMLGLSAQEFDVARYLFEHLGRVVLNAEVTTYAWWFPWGSTDARLDGVVARLRAKLQLGAGTGWAVRRLRRDGYVVCRDARAESRPDGSEPGR